MNVDKLTRVPLREVWTHEAAGFTRWLEDNVEIPNEVIDLNVAGAERERVAASFSVDLVAEDEDGGTVVIENQLQPSDHDHLGKLLTYVAALEAKAAIWIVSRPRPEHVKAVTWLNETTETPCYLLQVEAVKIGDSEPAPLLTQIVGPSPEARAAGETRQELSERHRIRRSFWNLLLDRAKTKTTLHSAVSPGSHHWVGTGAGMSGLGWNYSIRQHDTQVEVYIDRGDEEQNLRIFEELLDKEEEIETAFGGPLDWQRLEGRRACRIRHRLERGGWKDQDEWLKRPTPRSKRWFASRRPSAPTSRRLAKPSPAEAARWATHQGLAEHVVVLFDASIRSAFAPCASRAVSTVDRSRSISKYREFTAPVSRQPPAQPLVARLRRSWYSAATPERQRVPRNEPMGRHPTRNFLRQPPVDELADDARDEDQGHLEQGCVGCLGTLRELLAHMEQDLSADLLRFCNPGVSADELQARFGYAVRQTFYRTLTVEEERRLGPTFEDRAYLGYLPTDTCFPMNQRHEHEESKPIYMTIQRLPPAKPTARNSRASGQLDSIDILEPIRDNSFTAEASHR